MLFDTHAHYDDKRFNDDRVDVINKAYENGVKYILNASASPASIDRCIQLTKDFDFVYASVGVHPHDAKNMNYDILEKIIKLAKNDKVVAIGEIGLDYHYDFSPKDIQKKWLLEQIQVAKELDMPVIIHNRESSKDMMEIIKNSNNLTGVFHCFSGSVEMSKELMKKDFYISVGGPLTFKNAKKTVEVVSQIPKDRILIETDSPYLTPEPFRGKRNDSSYMKYVAEKIAWIWNIEFEEVANITTNNAKRLFKIND